MNCGKHRRPSIRRPTAARQRYEQSRLSEKAETARNGNFRPAIRRPTAEVESKTATSRQNVAAAPKRSANTGCPNKNGFSPPFRHTPATRTEPCRHFPAKINFSPARNRQSLPPHSRRIRTIKELLTQPANGRIRPRTADPIDSPPQLLPQPPQPALPASEVVRFSPNEGQRDYSVLFGGAATRIPLRRKDLRESRHYRHGLRPRTNDRRMTDIEIYDCRGKSIFFREPVPNKRRICP